jgi:hypothetical protein
MSQAELITTTIPLCQAQSHNHQPLRQQEVANIHILQRFDGVYVLPAATTTIMLTASAET